MTLPTLDQIREAQSIVYRHMPPTAQISWPLLNERLGAETWMKHENHTPVGAFKLRGALVYCNWLKENHPGLMGVVAATRGNFGQGVAMAARLSGLKAVIVVPHGNNIETNHATRAQGAELVEHGEDFQASLEHARILAGQGGFIMVESFHEQLVHGTATFALEFFGGSPPLDIVYVPIGMGSSICGIAAARNALKLSTEIVGVVSTEAPAAALSFAQHAIVPAPARTKIADGMACRLPHPDAMEIMWQNVARMVQVTDAEIMDAMRACFEDTHNLAEGAGAASLAGALKEKAGLKGKRVGIILTGANVDRKTCAAVLAGTFQ